MLARGLRQAVVPIPRAKPRKSCSPQRRRHQRSHSGRAAWLSITDTQRWSPSCWKRPFTPAPSPSFSHAHTSRPARTYLGSRPLMTGAGLVYDRVLTGRTTAPLGIAGITKAVAGPTDAADAKATSETLMVLMQRPRVARRGSSRRIAAAIDTLSGANAVEDTCAHSARARDGSAQVTSCP